MFPVRLELEAGRFGHKWIEVHGTSELIARQD